MSASNFLNQPRMDDALKGLLMDKGAKGLKHKIQHILHKLSVVHTAMDDLVAQQKLSADTIKSDAVELYLATNLHKEFVGITKYTPAGELTIEHSKAPLVLEWRGRQAFCASIGLARMARIYGFQVGHPHYDQLLDYVVTNTPEYYDVLVGFDAIRITLNSAAKILRRTALELVAAQTETTYIQENHRTADRRAQRILNALPNQDNLVDVLQGLYCY